jgi:1-deoxy-D-xylulose-5-phosphate synthase
MTVIAPSDENECRQLLYTACMDSPTAVRYPRGVGPAEIQQEMTALPVGKGARRSGKGKVAILALAAW